jgi:GTP pyrophosphokinase
MEAMPRHKQRRISLETLNVYVPIAERLGLTQICQEHTELCFKLLYPKRYNKTLTDIDELKKARIPTINGMRISLQETLEKHNLEYKTINPLFVHPSHRIQEKGPIDHVLEGFRIIVNNSLDCFKALGMIHTSFNVIPLKIRDYISNPLWNGYEGIQTELRIEGEQTCIEIVSEEMLKKNQHLIAQNYLKKCLLHKSGDLEFTNNLLKASSKLFSGHEGVTFVLDLLKKAALDNPNHKIFSNNINAFFFDFFYFIK